MRLLLLCLATLPAVFGNAINIEKCAWGESYWCSDIKAAVACGAFKHCMSTVWKNQKLTSDSSDNCQFCEALIDDVHQFIIDNKTEQDIANFLSTACNLCPEKFVASECSTLVKTYIPELITMVTGGLRPQVVCSAIHLCSGLTDTAQHSEVKEPPAELIHVPLAKPAVPITLEPICSDCKKFFTDIKNLIADPTTINQTETMINENICPMCKAYKQSCINVVDEFVPVALLYLQSFFDADQMCVDFAFCGTSLSTPAGKSKIYDFFTYEKIGSPDSCLLCKTVLSEVQTMERSATFQTMVENVIKNDICAHVGALKTECVSAVNQYAPVLFELVSSFMDPSTRCRSLGFCPADDLLVTPVRIGAEEAKIPAVQAPAVTEPLKRHVTGPSAECIICEFVMKEVDSILEDNKTEAAIIGALEKVCSYLPKTVAESCKSFVDTYGPAIISILQTEVTPDQVCALIGLCKQTHATATISAAVKFENKGAGDTETCLICETLVQYVEAMIENNASVSEVEAVVKKICNFLPDTMKVQCDNIIDTYGPLIIQYITTKYDPKEVCTLIGVCTSKSTVRMANLVPAMSMPGSNQCTHGPSYWCASQENAEKCGAVEHCQTYVWKKLD